MAQAAQADAQALKEAMKGSGTNEASIIQIVAHRTNAQRQQIKLEYKTMFGRDLIVDLKSALHGKFEDAVVALFSEPIEYDCDELRRAMKGFSTSEDIIIEILASRPAPVLKKIIAKYQEKFNRNLEDDIKKETSGSLRHLLIALLQCNRSTVTNPEPGKCAKIAKEIYDAGEAKLGTDEAVFNKYFCMLSPQELARVSQEYHKLTGHTILDAVKAEFSGNSKKALHAIVYANLSPSEYFATRIRDAIKGWGTRNKLLIRIIINRSEIDLPAIKQYYKQLYGKDMVEAIKDDIKGDYQKLMIELLSQS